MTIRVSNIEKGLLWDNVTFTADRLHTSGFMTMFGEKIFFMERDESVTLKIGKNHFYIVDDDAHLDDLVTMWTQHKFSWNWNEQRFA